MPRRDRFARRRCRWIENYQRDHPGVQINYQSIGSGGGIQQLKNGVVGFGACDMALGDDALKNMPAIVQIPESAEPGCITYNLPNLNPPLKLRRSESLRNLSWCHQELAGCHHHETIRG